MNKLDELTCRQALKLSHVLLCGGLLLLLAGGTALCVNTAPRGLAALLLTGGTALMIGGLILAVRKVRCPAAGRP